MSQVNCSDALHAFADGRRAGAIPSGPWDRRPDEPVDVWNRFILYLALGPSRSIRKLVRLLRREDIPGQERDKGGTGKSVLGEYSAAYDWPGRAAAWDASVGAAALPTIWDRQVDQLGRARRRHRNGARKIERIAVVCLEAWKNWVEKSVGAEQPTSAPTVPLDIGQSARMLDIAHRLERQALGMDLRDQVAMGRLVPFEQRDFYAKELGMLIETYVPVVEQKALLERLNRMGRALEGR